MLTPQDIELMQKRKHAAKNALLFFKEKKIKSPNNPFAFVPNDQQDFFYDNRGPNALVSMFDFAATTGMGNCHEKAVICWSSLLSNPLLMDNSVVTLCESIGYDHVYVIVANRKVGKVDRLRDDFDVTLMVVDGWTEDWYFPNLGKAEALHHNLGRRIPNPRQQLVRHRIAAHYISCHKMAQNTIPVELGNPYIARSPLLETYPDASDC